MADTTIKNKIIVEGEAQYRKAMRDITAAIKEQRSALKAASAEYEATGGDMRSAAEIGEALERTYAEQGRALAEMEAHLNKVEDAYGKNSREAMELRTKINSMRAEMARSESQMRDFRNRLDDVGSGADEAARGIDELGDAAQENTGKVQGIVESLSELTGISVPDLTIGAGVAGAAALVGKGLEMGSEAVSSENRMAAMTGASGAQLDAYMEAAKGVYMDAYADSMQEAVAGTAAIAQNTKLTGEALEEASKSAFMLEDAFGMDVQESARAAGQMMTIFGVEGAKAYDMIAAAAQNGADKNGNLLDTINEYAPYFQKAGKGAEEFMNALMLGGENGIYDIDKIGDGFKEFSLRVVDGSDTTKEALKALGLEATDLPAKFAAGGEGASAAFDLVIASLLTMEDAQKRYSLGVALFGTQWEDTGGKILDVYAAMASGSESFEGALQAMKDARIDDLGVQIDRFGNTVKTVASDALRPFSEDAAHVVGAVTDTIVEHVEKQEEEAAKAAEIAKDVANARTALDAELARLNSEIAASDAAGDWAKSLALTAQRDAIIADIAALAQEVVTGYETMGADAAAALNEKSADMGEAGKAMSQAAIDALDTAQPDMLDAGDSLGGAGVIGMRSGLSGSYAEGTSAANSVADGLRSGINSAYAAGWQTGKAYERGYKNALDQHSPSRVMQAAAEYSVSPLLERFEDAQSEIRARGAALGEAMHAGYRTGAQGAPGGAGAAQGAGADISPDALADAIKAALDGLGVYMSGDKVGEMSADGVSRTISRRGAATIKGRSTSAKSW